MKNDRRMKLWYDAPAAHWLEALPLGNGQIGAMVYGDPRSERIALNEDTLWSGYPHDTNREGADVCYREAAKLAMQGDYAESQACIKKGILGPFTQAYLPLGDIQFDFQDTEESQRYYRELDLERAICGVNYSQSEIKYRREYFISAVDSVFVIKLEADRAAALNFTIKIDSQLRHGVLAERNRLILDGICPSHVDPIYVDSEEPVIYCEEEDKKGMGFRAIVDIESETASIKKTENALRITQADSVIIRVCVRTGFAGFDKHPHRQAKDYQRDCLLDMEDAKKWEYEQLKERHLNDYMPFFKRMDIQLGQGREDLPVDRRLAREDKSDDLGLYALLFQYGRYLLIASSREGTQATTLQGIWNREIRAPWSSNYTLNINTQMNYWLAESCHLPEMHRPLFDFIARLRLTGSHTAQVNYRANGFVVHHNSDIWAHSAPVGDQRENAATYAFWPLAAGWLCRHLFEHYEYSLDRDFLRETAFPLIKSASDFFMDVLMEDEDGTLVFCPTTSPENMFRVNGNEVAVAKNTTMTTAIIREAFENTIACCSELGIEKDYSAKVECCRSKLPPYQIGSKGQLLEWNEEFCETDPQHRHSSHLYPLFPANHIDFETEPTLADACKKTLQMRGNEGTGWALAWRMCLWARLREGNIAFDFLERQLRMVSGNEIGYGEQGGSYPNLFGAHPPFQIDSNFGVCAGIAEMFLQSKKNDIYLLPALPEVFQNGFIHGLRAKGGVLVDIDFENGELKKAIFSTKIDVSRRFTVHYTEKKETICLSRGQKIEFLP